MLSDREWNPPPKERLRDPAQLMRPDRLGALKQTRLSFARLLIGRMTDERWDVGIDRMDLDESGIGRVVYGIETPSHRLSFGVFSRTSSDDEDTDRIIAKEWDLWAFLCEGEATPELMDHQREELPHVMEGRATPEILTWTRANRSSRFFGHIVDSLAAGHQPDIDFLSKGGYLMRSSGYYGNGLNGTKMFEAFGDDHPLRLPYMPQMLSAWMLRVFGYDLAEHMAAAKSADAVSLDRDIKRYLGTGNSSGVGIIMYVINHPKQLHTWLRAREIAFARAKGIDPTDEDVERFRRLLGAAHRWFSEDDSETNRFFASKDRIAAELDRIGTKLGELGSVSTERTLWKRLDAWAAEELGAETQEVLNSLLLDTYPEACAGLEDALITSEKSDTAPEMSVGELRSIIAAEYGWALDIDFSRSGADRHFWYRSIENEEPRIGLRGETGYEEYELPVDIARLVQGLDADLAATEADTVAEFLFRHPEHRRLVERIQNVRGLSYAEIRGNPLDASFVPLYFIACLKAIWGIQKTHPKSKGWVKGTFFQGAPLREDVRDGEDADCWMYPSKPEPTARWRGA